MSSPNGKYFAPKPGRFGKHPIFLSGPGSYTAITTFTASGTTTFNIPTPYRKLRFEKGSVSNRGLPGFSAAAAGVATIFRVRDGTATAITASLTLDALTSLGVNAFTILSTYTDDDLLINEGDNFQVQVSIGTATVTTTATDLAFTIEAGVLE